MAYKVLVFDSNEYERDKIKINLGSIGKFSFVELSNTQDFFVAQRFLEDISLIIIDIEFPTANDGYMILNTISQNSRLSSVPLIVITREDSVFHKNKILTEYHAKDYILKPYTNERLSNSIRSIIPNDAQFFYSFENTSIVKMSVEDYIIQQLSITKRVQKELSLIFITPNLLKMSEINKEISFNELKCSIYENILKFIKLTLRTSDIVLLVNKTDIIVLLHFTNAIGANNVSKKIKESINEALKEMGFKFEDAFYLSSVTFPNEGEDIDSLMHIAIKKVNNTSSLDKIVSVNKKKFDAARASYKRYS
jgi:DNA-binding response OmpR family regulator